MRLSLLAIRLDDADSVGDVERVVVFGETAVRLLGTIRADERVHLQALNVVHTLDGILDLLLVRARVDDEDQRVVGFNLRHGALRRERVLQDLELVELLAGRHGNARVRRLAFMLQSTRSVERRGESLLQKLPLRTLLHKLGRLGGLVHLFVCDTHGKHAIPSSVAKPSRALALANRPPHRAPVARTTDRATGARG